MFMSRTALTVYKPPTSTVAKCGKCGLYKTCKSEKMPVSGNGKKKILIVGESPGEDEDNEGIQFVGRSGRELQRTLDQFNVDLREDCWLDNALRCRPPDNKIEDNRRIAYCRPNVINAIKSLKPRTIILLGAKAVESVIGHLWKDKVGGIGRWAGWKIPHQRLNAWICPTFHPAHLLRNPDDKVLEMQFKDHLKQACKLKGRPWKDKPNYESQIKVILDDKKAADYLSRIHDGDVIAFDFENDRLKPDHKESEIVSCSVCCNGKWTIAFPWYGKVVRGMERILRRPRIRKIASNIKHEDRWCLANLGYEVKGWWWDTMLAAHTLDARGRISSIKFQAFVRLGIEDYDHHIKPYLETKGGNTKNRIKEVDLNSLLIYNGLDSLLEYEVAFDQRRELNADVTDSM